MDPLFFFAGFFALESVFEYDDSGAVANLQHKHVTRNEGFHLDLIIFQKSFVFVTVTSSQR